MNSSRKKYSACTQASITCREGEQGVTLIELMVAIAVLFIAIGAIFTSMSRITRSYSKQATNIDIQQAISNGSAMIIQDIRIAGYNPSGNSGTGAGFEVGAANKIQFTADLDGSGVIDNPDASDGIDDSDMERIAYEYNGAGLVEQVLYQLVAPGSYAAVDRQTLMDNISSMTFSYLDEDGNVLVNPVSASDLVKIRTVILSIKMNKSAGTSGNVERTFTGRVRCRNML